MRLTDVAASALALALIVATPTFAQTSPSGTAAPAPHSTTASPNRSGGSAATAPTGASQAFKTEAEAKSACGSQPVVWANTASRVLHAAGTQYYGKTKQGAYMCQNTAEQAGYHMAKNGQ